MRERAAQTVMDGLAGGDQAPFEVTSSFRCVSPSNQEGPIQFVDARDRTVEEIWVGASGTPWKEHICRRILNGVSFHDDPGAPPDTSPHFS